MRIGISLPVRELQNDLAAIREFAQTAEELDFTHLRVPELVIRPGGGHLHEPLTLLSWVAALTSRIELVPSVLILPARQTALVARQTAAIDVLSGGRLRLGVGVGTNAEEYAALGQDFHTRGQRCEEQIALLRLLWTQDSVDFEGRWDRIRGAGIDPRPVQQPIPLWIGPGGGASPSEAMLRRIGRLADGWFAILPREHVAVARGRIA
ncbi:MAG: TIGR03619 family F420-dependent LLM class oxidoreductase, partial [Chloroflexi bacterium]|nr:TIGR03619 family F420-dependent LLM class oxidoreductase [Chloroflexota bacterium]